MRKNRLALVGLLGIATVAAFVAGAVVPRVSAQGSIQVIPVRNGGGTCRDMTNDLGSDRDAWRTPYFNYMAGFVTGANFVSYLVPGRDSHVPVGLPVAGYSRADDAVFALVEQYCAQNSAKNISEAMMIVYSRLAAKSVGVIAWTRKYSLPVCCGNEPELLSLTSFLTPGREMLLARAGISG